MVSLSSPVTAADRSAETVNTTDPTAPGRSGHRSGPGTDPLFLTHGAPAGRQPLLHDLVTTLRSPTAVLSAADGSMGGSPAEGVFCADLRAVRMAELIIDGHHPEHISTAAMGAESAEFVSVLRWVGDPGPDPTVWLRRRRNTRADGMDEILTVVNVSGSALNLRFSLRLATDLAEMDLVKGGLATTDRPLQVQGGKILAAAAGVGVTIQGAGAPSPEIEAHGDVAELNWTVPVAPRGQAAVRWSVSVDDSVAVVLPAKSDGGLRPPVIIADDRRLAPLVTRSIADLEALRMATPQAPGDSFLAAGSPWYLTLFGRDSIWAARMLLPLGTDLAAGTLRTLAHRQGDREDVPSAQEPGKILHEIRRPLAVVDSAASGSTVPQAFLPPVYYGTVDATPLWLCLLADAWRWGMPLDQVRELMPAAQRALEWLERFGDSDGDGFLEYIDRSGRGLANQGWKDSADSVRFADGRIADGPVALAEVQGYAYQAALAGADLLEAFGLAGAAGWRRYAADLAQRFRAKFWAVDDLGRYPVLALDGVKAQVDSPASNMGHLPGTGVLSPTEAAAVARRLVDPSMFSGFGLRTMAQGTGGYSPLSYHCGSVWPHDTAIAVHGLLGSGFGDEAAVLARGLLVAGDAFDGRFPELLAGFSADDLPSPVPYPASCRPQAWSAASAVVLVQAMLGLSADVPAGRIQLRPAPVAGALSVDGLQVGGRPLGVSVDAAGKVTDVRYDGPLDVTVGS